MKAYILAVEKGYRAPDTAKARPARAAQVRRELLCILEVARAGVGWNIAYLGCNSVLSGTTRLPALSEAASCWNTTCASETHARLVGQCAPILVTDGRWVAAMLRQAFKGLGSTSAVDLRPFWVLAACEEVT
jgi:hypothetical protein